MSLDDRLRRLEAEAAQRRRRNNPMVALRIALQTSMMLASVPTGPDGSPARQEQLERVARLQRAWEAGDPSGVENELANISPESAGTP